ncbi:hypothetical protein XENORESO_019482 [Xenotaenia resolanae]|uniref:Uncharacterized protein n=1 Tax=Xenotaenia resolanae TaxID=208358 RepID=A0ABV0X720_9TELE
MRVCLFFSFPLTQKPALSTNTPVCHELLEGMSNSFIHGESLWWCQLVPSLLSHWKLMEDVVGVVGEEDTSKNTHTQTETQIRSEPSEDGETGQAGTPGTPGSEARAVLWCC